MIRSLRRKFSLAITLIVGIVLAYVLGSNYYTAWSTQRDIVNDSLDRALEGDVRDIPVMDDVWAESVATRPQSAGQTQTTRVDDRAHLLILSIDLTEAGSMIESNGPAIVDAGALAEVVSRALSSSGDKGWDADLHVAWKSVERDDGSWRVVMADTSAIDLSMSEMRTRYLTTLVVSMIALVCISLLLSSWMVRPVEKAWEQQRQFVADASHELKTPLAVILANTQILERGDSVSPEGMRWVESTADEASHMRVLVEELLELARTDEVSSGTKGVMRKEPVDLSELVESATLEFDAMAFERGCTIREAIEEGIVVEGDEEWLSRLCRILIDNACKYANRGTEITVTLEREGRQCHLLVNNHGAVVDEQDLPHLFDRFYRTDKARSRDSQASGFGLGLAIAQGICTSHGGSIDATSSELEGTTFRACLPTKA